MKKYIIFTIIFTLLSILTAEQVDITLSGDHNSIDLINQQPEILEFSAEISELYQLSLSTRSGDFSELIIPGFGTSGETGTPRLPVKRELIAVPLGAELSIEIADYQSIEYQLSDLGIYEQLIPVQPPTPKSIDPSELEFAYDQLAFEQDKWYGNEIFTSEEIGILRGQRIFTVTYHPLAYNPVQQKIIIYNNVNATVNFVGSDQAATQELRQKTWSPAYEKVYSSSLINYTPLQTRDDITRYPIKYVIISDEMFTAQLQPFINWKTQQGYNVIETYTSEIGGSTAAIANYVESLWEEATPEDPAPSFILFVGDTAQIPAYNGATGSHVTDLNYVRLEGNDYLPEIYYGRFSARNTAELQPQIDKTLEYEMFTMPDPSYLEEVVMIAGVDAAHSSTWANGQINYGTSNYFNAAHGITSHTYLYPASGSSAAQIVQNVSDGAGYVNYTAHGSSTSWADPSFTISNINSLQNEHEYPLVVGNCCLTNKFEVGECFGEAWLREENGGAIGYIGGTNSTYWDEDFWWGVGSGNITSNPTYNGTGPGAYDGMFHDHGETFPDWYTAQAAVIMAGNLAVVQGGGSANYYWEIYSLMGDPSLVPYFGVPQQNTVSHAAQIFIGSSQFTVSAEPYSYVGLSIDGELLAGGLIEASGSITLGFQPLSSAGTLDLVVCRQNHEPYIADIAVVPNEGAFLTINDFSIYSDNGDEIIDFGETIQLSIDLENIGTDEASAVVATLSINDPYITITNNTVYQNAIAAGSIETLSGFTFQVADNIPDQYAFQLDFSFSYDQGENDAQLDLLAHAPVIALGNLYISGDDNNNGRLDPGETADIDLEILNNGSSIMENVICMVSTNSEYITIYNTWSFIPQILPNGSGLYPFMVEVAENCPEGEIIYFSAEVTAGTQLTYTGSVSLNIGLSLEDFESGDLSNWEWTTSGNANWFVTTEAPYEGSYCVESGDIGNSQISSLSIELDVLYDDEISFFRKVSSEANWDYLLFYIDDEEIDSWSGTQAWAQVSYPISAGSHELSWVYDKDGSLSSGSDCAWLDYIIFPAIGIPQPPEMTCSVDEITQIIELNSTALQEFSIANTGGGTLYYFLSIAETDRSIEGSTFTCDAETYIPGATVTWNLEVYNNSSDTEWLTDILLDFPPGVSVISATDFTGGSGDLIYNGVNGAGASVEWNDPDGGWGEILGNETATASITVIVDANQAGDIMLNWTLIGDDFGSAPHQLTGTITLTTEIIQLDWVTLSQYDGVLNGGESDQITINFDSIDLDQGIYTANLVINDNRQITTIPVTMIVGGDIAYGDIDDNGYIEAFDASLVLQYAVGIDPAPFAPLPWESWRLLRSDVDGNDFTEAFDASLILQYSVGLISSFPVENRLPFAAPQAEISYSITADALQFYCSDELYSLYISTQDNSLLGSPLYHNKDMLTAFNNDETWQTASAAAQPATGHILTIPLNSQDVQYDLKLALSINGYPSSLIIPKEELMAAFMPSVTQLNGNYPNPFNPTTAIKYQLADDSQVKLDIYNIKGQHITSLVNDFQTAGEYNIIWQGTSADNTPAPSGIYLYKLTSGSFTATQKMILLK
ncbi:MAG: T9SS type A sorting domain-containing protein [Candidatus Cloacimonetes bacterium]|nr:T9SS type A sorting domain-containing protein [Candidatus Cloacimonadota bacterium]